jgi:O-antigen ligase
MPQSKILKLIYIGCITILFLPLLITPFTMYPMHYGRTMIFEIIVEILFLFSVFGFLFSGVKFPRLNLLDKSILIFLIVQFVAAVFGVDPEMSFFGNMGRVQGVFTWFHFALWYFLLRFLFTQIDTNENTNKHKFLFLKIAGVASFLVTLSAIFSFAIPYLKIQVGGWGRISGTIGNSIFFASYLILPIFLNLYLAIKTSRRERYFWIFVVLLEIFALIQSGTRGAIVGFAASLLFLLVFGLAASSKAAELKKWRTIFIVCLLVIFLVGSILSYLGFSGKQTGFAAIDRLTQLVSFKGTAATRLMAWQIAWQAFLEKPILGWGPENFKFVFHRHYNPEYLTYGFAETVWDKPHNLVLEFAATTGILGVLAYLGIFAAAFYYLFKFSPLPTSPSRGEGEAGWGRVLLAGGLLAYFIQNLFIFETSNSLIVFFLVLAFASNLRNNEISTKTTKTPTPSLPLGEGEGREGESYFGLKCFGFIVLAILVCFSLWVYHVKPLRASYYLAKADDGFRNDNFSLWVAPVLKSFEIKYPQEHECLEIITRDLVSWDTKYKIPNEEMAQVLPLVASRLENQTKKRPSQFVYHVWLGQVYSMMCERMDVSYCKNAEENFQKAIEIAPVRQDAKMLLAKVKLLEKDFDEAVRINRELVEFQPDLPVTHWFLGLSLIAAGQKDEGILELEKGADFGLNNQQNILYMVDLYNEKKEYNKIVELYKRLLQMEPKQAADWWARLAATYAAIGDKAMTEEAVTRAVELNPALEAEARAFLQELNQKLKTKD